MAAKLQCEICGGKLIGRPGGIFECDSCGTEYSTEWAKAKIQEISGTVKIEGPVEVQGKVEVSGVKNRDSQIKRGNLALEDGEWEKAKEYFNEALDADAECAEAYLGLAMASVKIYGAKEIPKLNDQTLIASLLKNAAYKKYLRFASLELKQNVDALLQSAEERKEAKEKREQQKLVKSAELCSQVRARIKPVQSIIAAGEHHVIGLKTDGSVLAKGDNSSGQCNVSDWRNIVAVAAGSFHTVGLKATGRVVAIGDNTHGQCNIDDWSDIIYLTAGENFTVGIRSDGTVLAAGSFYSPRIGREVVERLNNLVSVSTGSDFVIGLKANGKVVFDGLRDASYSDTNTWTDIVQVSSQGFNALGLKENGTVVSCGGGKSVEWKVDNWRDIVAISTGDDYIIGLQADGSVAAAGSFAHGERERREKNVCYYYCGQCEVSKWGDIVAVAAGGTVSLGLKADGTVVAAGRLGAKAGRKYHYTRSEKNYDDYECDVSDWKLFDSIETIKEERQKAVRQMEEYLSGFQEEQVALKDELANLKGIFSGKRRKEIEARLAQIDAEIKKLK